MDPTDRVFDESAACLLHNPTARGGRAGMELREIAATFNDQGLTTQLVSAGSRAELESCAREAIDRGCRLLLVLGGDGTVQSAANVIVESGKAREVLLGILPAGGGNDFAAALGLPPTALAAARQLVELAPVWSDLVWARTADGRERHYLGGGGLGLDARAAELANSTYRHWPGKSRYLASALRALYRFRPLGVRIDFLDEPRPAMEASVLLAGVLNTPTYGAGLRLAPDARPSDGWLNLVLIEELGFLGVVGVLVRLLLDRRLRASAAREFRIRRVRLTTDRPAVFHGDGEIFGPAPVEIEVRPRAIQVLAPRVKAG